MYYIFQLVLWTLLGAGDIGLAIMHFKDKHYFRFGFWTMMTIMSVTNLIEFIITG